MQLKTEKSLLNIGNRQRPSVTVAISPRSPVGYVIVGMGLGVVLGFVAGSALTLLVGDKSLLLVQHLWQRLTGGREDGDQVHFELLLQ